MEPGSPASPSTPASQPLANLMGSLIALLTLIAPIMAIVYFSANSFSVENSQDWPALPQVLGNRE
ncbi:MAG: hypothetical protein HY785_14320 [Oscillatoriophycideae cyanobacterium NC_groundwater_1537_Pr4_S-0.65um_50_18]|nr:hypothetical protein [Oscillatoriophycideae cyanobacterium NC_groundwater_1537_Pr4_S-0.65um_50_18]